MDFHFPRLRSDKLYYGKAVYRRFLIDFAGVTRFDAGTSETLKNTGQALMAGIPEFRRQRIIQFKGENTLLGGKKIVQKTRRLLF